MTVSSDIAFTPAVKAEQQKRGSRAGYARMEAKGGWPTVVTDELAGFIGATRSFFLATASKDGQPYMQHRGGPEGFLRVLDENTLAFADFSGNKQYITSGNLGREPARVHLHHGLPAPAAGEDLGRGPRGAGGRGVERAALCGL